MLFKIGLILIPFENLFFAPSSGWAAIAPIIFFFYVLINFKSAFKNIKKVEIYIILTLILVTLTNYIRFSFITKNLIDNIITLILGYTFYIALRIRYLTKKSDFTKDINILFNSYLVSLIIGLVQFLTYRLKIESIINLFRILSKRFYYPRVQLTYTEPSFIPIHLFGVMLVILIFCLRNNVKLKKKLYIIFFLNIILTNLIVLSARLALDTIIVSCIVGFCYILKSKKIIYKILFFISIPIFISGIFYIVNTNARLDRILKNGVYTDASLASRWFRINASIKGYKNSPYKLLTGYGIGNLYIPFDVGYAGAKKEYKNDYLFEVYALKGSKPTSLFSMPIKLISEFGLIIFSLILLVTFSYKYLDIYLLILYLYLQFDSYALYTIWFYIFLKNNSEKIFNKEIE
ncbi:hypothetical protein [Candidatus Cetobacterium colombiensis]|uniref:O-antigen polymerase n=1 Tax=Candidatus Cetobacterium colombiensis TaxID=3073100 RepID=A0ABU4W8T5_9FUSO|nr:hypothetical protein [Candidatus Cetobacterium colombiensis]MDX8335940.1 hypothetical protein [Candidatus Cetobacterium colombiensis]